MVKDFIWSSIANVGGLVLSFVVSILLARMLGPELRGQLAGFTVALSTLTLVCMLGWNAGVLYQAGRSGQVRKYQSIGVALAFLLCAATIAVTAVSRVIGWPKAINQLDASMYWLLMAAVTGNLLQMMTNAVLVAAGKVIATSIIGFLVRLSNLLLVVVLIGFSHWAVVGAIVGTTIATFTGVGMSLIVVRPEGIRLHDAFQSVRSIFSFGFKSYVGNVASFFHYRVDQMLILPMLGASQLGYYAVAAALADIFGVFPDTIAQALTPRMLSNEEKDPLGKLVASLKVTFCLAFLEVTGSAVLAGVVIPFVYSARFLPAVRPFQILMLAAASLSLAKVLATARMAEGKPGLNARVTFGVLALNFSLNLLVIPKYGITGAAWVSVLSYSAEFVYGIWHLKRTHGISLAQIVPSVGDWRVVWASIGRLGNLGVARRRAM